MKRIGNLYKNIYNIDNLRIAFKNAKRGKGWYYEVKTINQDIDKYLYQLQDMLINKTYHTSEYEIFSKQEGKKIREIYKLPFFPDRVCQWAIMQVIEPYLIKNFINTTYSAIPNRGTHKVLNKVYQDIKNNNKETQYCLKIDVRKYYPSINHDVLKSKYRQKFKDKDLLWLLDEIIDSIPEYEGIPIGNYLSQYSANFYLSSFDHWCKEDLNLKYYYRYMDDIVILSDSKLELHNIFIQINKYMQEKLKLTIKDNWQIFPTNVRGIDFVGYRIFNDYILLRKSTCINMKNKMKSLLCKSENKIPITYSDWCSFNSYKGILKHCNSIRLEEKYIRPLDGYMYNYYLTNVKKGRGMKTYKNTRSTIKPISDTELLETKVFLYRNIHEITEGEFTGYEFDMIEYDKNEYIQSIKSRNDELTEVVADLIGGAV